MRSLTFDPARLREVCDRFGVASLEVFGSTARGEAGAGSDIDLLYTLVPGRILGWEIDQLEDELESVFSRPVDLVSRKALNVHLREVVLREARPLYAAA